MSDLRVGHGSGKWSADKHDVAHYVAHEIHSRGLDLFGCTEAQQRGIVRAVRAALGPGFGVAKRGEYLAVWRRATVRRLVRPARMWHLTAIPELVEWREFRVGVFWFRHRPTATPVRLMVGHAPSGVQAGSDFRTDSPRQVEASRCGFAAWGRKIRRLANRRPGVLQLAVMDSNLDQRNDHWRQWLTGQLGAPSVYAGRVPNRGSHDVRLIDTGHICGAGARVTEAGVSAAERPPGYDHRAIWFTARIPERTP